MSAVSGKHRLNRIPEPRRTFYRSAFLGAACFNAVYGAAMLLMPHLSMRVAQYPIMRSNTLALMLWQGIGLFVTIFAIGYWYASRSPERFAPFILIALIGKTLGILGFLNAWLIEGTLSGWVGVNVFFTDLIWLPAFVPFVWETCIKRRYEPQ